ncbi:class I SAM-dependent methyltransferase [Aestuariicoccus sp. MJ-SS9]|uniref:class I SAM-dependent methyltransferase n=1 Tax=Aestuariicoccus sp. MJ-SS9 TaxID=3079855 RepID=UPI00290965AB|nr:class I SAM-dependent methyltransferase [Aestuariicoccus sp. MJ-SS9]MDU8910013.1 class I SAM-dependent methyltransferase [Aestuariicoccus sp. MJ-SS9]
MDSNTEWQVSGNAAQRYEEHLVPVIFVPWAEHLIGRAGLRDGQAVLDIACGTGIVARMAADKVGSGGRVAGVDLNAGMLAVARDSAAAEGRKIDWQEGNAQDLPFDDGTFDAVFCQQGLQFFPDKVTALSEMRRVLKPGGRALVCVAAALAENPLMQTQVAAFDRHLDSASGDAIRAVCGLHDAATIRGLTADAGFADAEVEKITLTLRHPDARAFVAGLMKATPNAGRIADMPEDKRAQILQDLLDGFGACVQGDALEFPHVSHVIDARA